MLEQVSEHIEVSCDPAFERDWFKSIRIVGVGLGIGTPLSILLLLIYESPNSGNGAPEVSV